MTIEQFKEMIVYNEPVFLYKGKEYSICHPSNTFYVREASWPANQDIMFHDVNDLLNNWLIEGMPFKEILSDIDWG